MRLHTSGMPSWQRLAALAVLVALAILLSATREERAAGATGGRGASALLTETRALPGQTVSGTVLVTVSRGRVEINAIVRGAQTLAAAGAEPRVRVGVSRKRCTQLKSETEVTDFRELRDGKVDANGVAMVWGQLPPDRSVRLRGAQSIAIASIDTDGGMKLLACGRAQGLRQTSSLAKADVITSGIVGANVPLDGTMRSIAVLRRTSPRSIGTKYTSYPVANTARHIVNIGSSKCPSPDELVPLTDSVVSVDQYGVGTLKARIATGPRIRRVLGATHSSLVTIADDGSIVGLRPSSEVGTLRV